MISHYGSGSALTWTSEGAEKWTRNIPGIDGALDAIQESGKTPLLQLRDLQGDIVGTVVDSESETKLFSTYNSTEFGVATVVCTGGAAFTGGNPEAVFTCYEVAFKGAILTLAALGVTLKVWDST